MWSKLTIKTPERRHWRHWRRSGVFIVNFERISCFFSCGSMVDFEYYLLGDERLLAAGINYFEVSSPNFASNIKQI